MAGQSITFDFLTTGASRTASDFRKTGDNAALAAKGAKVLSNAIEKLGDKENRTAAESALLAKALRQTGEAEDRVTARAVVADAAIRRLDDAMQDSTRHSGALRKSLGGLKLNPGLAGPALLLAPALTSLAGVAAGAAAGLGGAFTAAAGALAGFGAIAKPVLTDAKKAAGAVETAQTAHAAAVAKVTGQYRYAMSVAKNKAQRDAAYAAEQKGFSAAGLAQTAAQAKAYAGMSAAQIALSRQLGDMADAWDKVKAAETPVVAGALKPWLGAITDLMGKLKPIIDTTAPIIADLGDKFRALVNSDVMTRFRDFVASFGAWSVSAAGSTLIDFFKAFMIILPQFAPLIGKATEGIAGLGPAVLKWAGSKKTADHITAFMAWFKTNGPLVGELLKNAGAALAALAPGLTAGAAAELKIISDFLGFVARLPPGLAKPLAEVAGAMLILQKTGVVAVGIKLVGLGAAASGAGAAAGPLAAAGAAIGGGILLGIRRSIAAGWKTAVSEVPKLLEGVGSILNFSASGWANTILDHFSTPVRKMWDSLGHFLASSFDITRHQVAHAWAVLMSDIASLFDIAKENIRITWDKIKILFLRGVDFIMTTMGKLPGPLGAPFRAAHASIKVSLGQIQGDVAAATRNIQADWDRIHGKTVRVNFVGSGSGSIAFKQSIPGVTTGPSSQGILGFHAAGGRITGGTPGKDSVLGMLMPGEVVVPTQMVNAGAVDHLRGQLPGFASGGAVTGMGASDRIPAAGVPYMANTEAAFGRAVEGAFARAVIAKFKKDAAGAFSATKVPNVGSGVMRWAPLVLKALKMEGLGSYLASQVLYQMNTESGGNPNAINLTDSNAARGDPSRGLLQTIGATFRAYHWPGTSWNIYDPLANIAAAINYARHRYGPSLMSGGMGMGSGHGYALGGLIPGFASGGTVGQQGAAWLKAWQTRHGGGFGAAWGPVVVNEQIARMKAAIGRATTLSHAGGLSAGQHKFWASAAADETKRLGVLGKELTTERAWRYQLGLNELGLDKEIRAAGSLPSLAGPVKGWKAQLGRDKATVAAISKMLGYSDAYLAAHPAAKPGPVLPKVTHTYGGDVANTIGAVLSAALGPFTGAARGGMVMDSGGTLRPGFNPVWNMTGRPESLIPARGGGGDIHLHLTVNAPVGSQQQLEDWYVKTANKLAQHGRLSHAVKTASR